MEHLLAALSGLGVDNAVVEVEGPEIPILDGSAAPWVEALDAAGLVELDAPRRVRTLAKGVSLGEDGRFMVALPAPALHVTYAFLSDRRSPRDQVAEFAVTPGIFRAEIAPARTVAFADELAAMRAAGLGKGGSLDNVVLFDESGPARPLRFEDEAARHKLLDIVGDLALLGPLCARIIAVRSSHEMTAALMRRILEVSASSEGV